FFSGLPIALLVVVGGVGSAWGALTAGVLQVFVPFLLAPLEFLTKPLTLLPATLGVMLGRSPDGIVGHLRGRYAALRADRRREAVVLITIAGLGVINLVGLLPFRFAAPAAIVVYIVGSRLAAAAADEAGARERVEVDGIGEIPPERIGVDRPLTEADIATCDRVLGLEGARR